MSIINNYMMILIQWEIMMMNNKEIHEGYFILAKWITGNPIASAYLGGDNMERAEMEAVEHSEGLVKDLPAAPVDVDTTLLVTQCAWCKRYQDEDGNWVHLELNFVHSTSHGICPECIKRCFGFLAKGESHVQEEKT